MKKLYLIIAFVLFYTTANSQTTIIAQNSSWKYLDNGSNQDTAWRATTFNDTSWASGNAELGYGDGGEATVVGSTTKPVTTYFRKTFSVANPSLYSTFTLKLLRDDGAVVYLNGVEVARSNMPSGTIVNTTLASSEISGSSESAYTNYAINPSLFSAGNNVLAIELHQRTTNNVDLSFNVKLEATTGTCGTPIALNASAITTSSATLSWSAIPNILSYRIQYRKVGTSSWTSTTSTTNSKALTGLTHSTAYEFQVRANCVLSGVYSAPVTFTTVIPTCAVPTALTASSSTTTTASLSWAAVTGATSYNIQYRKTGTTTWTTTTATTATKSLTGLTIGTAYEFQVQAVCVVNSVYSAVTGFTTLSNCGTPSALSTNTVTSSSATLSWLAVSSAVGYNIQYRPTGTATWLTTTSTTNSISIANLTAATTYEFQVQAVCTATGAFSNSVNFTTLAICDIPSALNATSITTSSATLNWQGVSGAVSYNIQYRPIGTATWLSTTSITNSKSITDLTAQTPYEFQVQTVCVAISNYSASANFTTLTPICEVPNNIQITNIAATSATLSWEAVVGATGYNIQYRPTGTVAWFAATSATASLNLSNLSVETNYEFQVQALCMITSDFSMTVNFTTTSPPLCEVPSQLSAANITYSTAVLSWQVVVGATGYTIQYRPTGTATWTNVNAINNSIDLSGLSAETSYEFQVQALCIATSAYSESAVFTTMAIPTCEVPTALSSSDITATTATLSWQAVVGATGYNIQYRPTGTVIWSTTNATATSINIADLLAATNYEFQVQALCIATSTYSESAVFTTLAIPTCEVPMALNSSDITTSTATLSWQAVVGATGYNIQYRPTGTAIWSTTNATATSINIADLLAATNYEFQVQALCIATSTYSESANFRTLMVIPTCDVPTALSATNVTTSTAALSWQAVSGATSYNIQYRRTGTATWSTTTATTTTKTLTGLLETSTYEFQVQAVCQVVSNFSTSVNFTTLTSGTSFIIAANSSWKYLDNGTNQGTAWRATSFTDTSWAAGNAELGYGDGGEATVVSYGPSATNKYLTTYFRKSFSIENPAVYSSLTFELIRDDGAVVYLNGTEIYRTNMPTGTIAYNTPANAGADGVAESTWYPVTITPAQILTGTNVIAVEIHQQYYDSSDISFNGRLSGTIAATATCATPDSLNATAIGSASATLNWQTVSGATSYNIQYRPTGTTTWLTATSTTASKSVTGLLTATPYEFQVQAVCAAISSFSAAANFTTTAVANCNAPTSIVASAIAATTATLNWQAAADAVSYNIQYRQTGTSTWSTGATSTTAFLFTGLTQATTYEFQIQSVCSSLSAFSILSNFTTTSQTCAAPTNLSISSTSSSAVTLSWLAVDGATSYTVEYQLAGAGSWVSSSSNTNTKTITGLIASTNYEFRVKSVCSANNSNYSTVLSFTTYAAGSNTLIAAGASWKYLDNGTNQATAWRSTSFNDSTWKTGTGEFGYGDGDETTIVSYGPSASAKYTTTYFRKTFTVNNPSDYTALSLGIIRDDGALVYLNGTEVYRDNMPSGTIAYTTYAIESLGGSDETDWLTAAINPSLLVAGTNVLAVEIHQQSAASSDVSFNARLTAPSSTSTPVVTRGAYLQKLSPNNITIRWRTDIPSNTVVQYGTSIAYGNSVSDSNLVTEHIINVSGLTPNTKYFYSIGTTTETLQGDLKNNFITAPVVGSTTPVRIWGIGDFGNGTTHQLNVRNSYMTYTGTTPTNLWIWLGDDAYTNGTDSEFQSRVFAQYPDQFKSMPLFPTIGNHDYADVGYLSTAAATNNFPYFSIFSLPQNGECGGVASNTPKYYSYNYANIHFISIDIYGCPTTAGSPIRTWLANDLATNSQRWTVVYMHHPPYTLGTHNSDTELELIHVRQNIVPLLESFKVDLVLAGHSHVNERSYMMKGHLGNSSTFSPSMKVSQQTNNFVKSPPYDGTVYAVCGTSGQDPEAVNQPAYPMAAMYFNNNTNNCSLVIDVNGDVLSCKYLASTGTVVDNFTITKTGGGARSSQITDETATAKDALSVAVNQNSINLDYSLSLDSEVTFELINFMGESIMTFNQIPASQAAGDYNYDVVLSRSHLAEGLYFIRMTINGKSIVKKVYVMK